MLAAEVSDVTLNGAHPGAQTVRDLAIGQPVLEQTEHVLLAIGERGNRP
jgi:hypothetical protein